MRHEPFGETVDSAQWGVTGGIPIDVWKAHNPNIMQLTQDEGKPISRSSSRNTTARNPRSQAQNKAGQPFAAAVPRY